MTTEPSTPEGVYTARAAQFGAERARQQRRSDINGNISLVLALVAVGLLGGWLFATQQQLLIAAGVVALAFLVSFSYHGDVNRALRRAATLATINDEGLRRLRRDWAAIPLYDAAPADGDHQNAADLDLLGRASLEHLLHTPTTPVGRATLRRWLVAPADVATIRARQAAVAELAPMIELRDDLALRGRLMESNQAAYERFLTWAESPPWLLPQPWLVWLSRVLAVVVFGLGGAQLLGAPVGLPLAVALIANLIAYFLFARAVESRIEQVTAKQAVFTAYAALFARVTASAWAAPELVRLQHVLAAGNHSADSQMRRLARLMPLAEIRSWMFFFPIQIATLWSIHVLWALERWQRDAGAQARAWLVALGEVEALAALATLHYDNPGWCFPELSDTPTFTARNLGHPLITPAACAGNDVQLGPPGQLLLVTGSNMSGKSTLLRAIGVNAVLAQAGGPVCADLLRLPPVAIVTSMRVRDALDQGVSYFMAELQRLKLVVDWAAHERAEGARVPLFLLDEILHGTNSAERLIAARRIIRHLLDSGAIGAVSTHDLALAAAPDLVDRSTLVHFSEQIARGPDGLTMTFDYALRPGVATSTNALALVFQVLGAAVAGPLDMVPGLAHHVPSVELLPETESS